MGIILEGKAVVAHIVGGIACSGHAAQGQQLQRVFLGLSLGLFHQFVERAGRRLRIGSVAERMAEILGETAQAVEFFGIGVFVDTIHEGGILRLALLRGVFRHATVGQQHELFDEPVALLAFLLHDIQGFARLIHDDFHLRPLERDGALVETLLAEDRGQGVEFAHLHRQRTLARLDDLLRLLIVETIVGIDDGAAEPLPDDLGLVVEFEHGAVGQFVFVRTQ